MPSFDLLAVMAWFTNPDNLNPVSGLALVLAQLVLLGVAVLVTGHTSRRGKRRRPPVGRLADPTYHPDLDGPDRHTRRPR